MLAIYTRLAFQSSTLDVKITITFFHTYSRYTIIHIPSGCLTLPTTHSVAIMKYVLLSITASMFNVWKVSLSDFHRTINHQNQENEEAVTHVTVTLVT